MCQLQDHLSIESHSLCADQSGHLLQKRYHLGVLFVMFLFVVLSVSGCGRWVSAVPGTMNDGMMDYEKKYLLKSPQAAFVGQRVLGLDIYEVTAEGRLNNTATPTTNIFISGQDKLRFYSITLKAGQSYPIDHTLNNGMASYYVAQVVDSNQYKWGVLINQDGSLYDRALYSYDYQMLFYPYNMRVTPCVFKLSHGRKTYKREITTALKSFEIIYSGKNDVSLNLLYREYVDDYARPAFSQHLTYQADAKQVRFQGFVIQVHSATNEQITYTILEDGLQSVFED